MTAKVSKKIWGLKSDSCMRCFNITYFLFFLICCCCDDSYLIPQKIEISKNGTTVSSLFDLLTYYESKKRWRYTYVTHYLIGKYDTCGFFDKFDYKSFYKMLNESTDNVCINISHLLFWVCTCSRAKICFLFIKNKHIAYKNAQNIGNEHLRSNKTISCLYEILRK